MDKPMTPAEAADYIGSTVGNLAKWRCQGKGPKFIKGGRIKYRKSDLDTWLDEHTFTSTSQARVCRA